MRYDKRLIAVGVAGALAVATLAACNSTSTAESDSTFNAALDGVVRPSNEKGGTLRVGSTDACPNWDPAVTYGGTCWSLHRLMSRTLVAYGMTGDPDRPGNGAKLYGDLATSLGKTNADKTVWSYTLRDGLRFSTGDPITSADIKYAFERQYATDVISGGPAGYWLCLLDTCDEDGAPTYKGPYEDPDGGLSSIKTPDDKTVVFHLNESFGDWDYLMALPAAAPVPEEHDKGAQYGAGTNVVASGPYYLASSTPKQSAVFERNEEWSSDTDPIRKALPDVYEITFLSNPDDLDARMKNGSLDMSLNGSVGATFQSEILNDPELKANADNPSSNGLWMLILYPSDPALSNVHCRRAVFYALDKRDILIQAGGTYGGEYATTLLPPRIPGHDENANPYPSGDDWTGDLDKARDELEQCGRPEGFDTVMAYSNFQFDPQVFASTQSALARVGINVTGKQIDSSAWYQTLSTPGTVRAQDVGIGTMGWSPDYPSGNGFLTLLVDGARYTGTSSSTNFVGIDDPEINNLVEQVNVAAIDEQAELYRQMDALAMESAYYLPMVHSKFLLYRGTRLTNVDATGPGGFYDLVNLGVTDAN